MDLRHLRSFCAVAREMNVTRAAQHLHIAQPALTQQIRHLEKELGLPLIRRTGRGIALTDAGAFFYKEAEPILQQMQSVCLQAQEIARGDAGHIVVGLTEASAFSPVLAAVFGRYRAKWPAVKLTFSQRPATDLAAALRDGQIDAAFACPLSVDGPDLSQSALAQNRMLLVVPASHPFASEGTVPLAVLEDEPLILVSHGRALGAFEDTLHEACRMDGFAPRTVQTCPELMLALNLAAAGVGLTFVPEYMSHARSDALRPVAVRAKTPLTLGMSFVTRARDESPLVAHLRDVAVGMFAQPQGGTPTRSGGSGAVTP